METLLIVAIVVTALAILVQAGVLVALYLKTKQVAANVDGLISESRRMIPPLEQVAHNVQLVSNDLAEMGSLAREEVHEVEAILIDARNAFDRVATDVATQVSDTVHEVSNKVLAPVREGSAIAHGIAEGFRVFFRRDKESKVREHPAA